ncbi:MAG: Gx transporter family protein [Lachnospiraceae bacterium]
MKRKVSLYGVLIAMALVASYLEVLVPINIGIPGVKLGLANLVTMIALCKLSAKEAVFITLGRIVLSSILFGNGVSWLYSMAGGVLSILVMLLLLKKFHATTMFASICGGIAHNIGQLAVAYMIIQHHYILAYFPVLLIAGILCGFVIGLLSGEIMKRLPKQLFLCVSLFLLCGSSLTGCQSHSEPYQSTDIAMNTVISMTLYDGNKETAQQLFERIHRLDEDVLNVNCENSFLSQVNAKAGSGEELSPDSELYEILVKLQKFSQKHPGTVSMTMGSVIDLWDFQEEEPSIPSKEETEEALMNTGADNLVLDNGMIYLKNADTKCNLGACGKGICADIVYRQLEKSDVSGALISFGNSTIMTYGSKPDGTDFQIALRHPRGKNGEYLGVLSVEGTQFVSTSGDYEQYFIKDGIRYHHILNPDTGYPSQSDLISATVICQEGWISDWLSTACMIVGEEEAKQLLDEYHAEGIFVRQDQTIGLYLRDKNSFTAS